ncbi:MAG: hypothetical protein MZV64_25065 [Ignavibacteriales bacterium]|nr:hypothetical protein [Ignavibacteriales bacterium]
MRNVINLLQEETPLRDAHLTNDELKILSSFQLLSIKPMLIALNLDETQVNETGKYLDELAKKKLSKHTKALFFSERSSRKCLNFLIKKLTIFME